MRTRQLYFAFTLALSSLGTATAGMSVEQRLALLEATTAQLENKIRTQSQIIKKKDQRIARLEQRSPEPKVSSSGLGSWWQGVSMSGLIEVEAATTDNEELTDSSKNGHASDISVAKVELGIDATVNNWTEAHLLLLWEESSSDNNLTIDEATITIGNNDVTPWFFTAGRTVTPFGAFETNLVSDPLTLSIGETKETIVMLGYEHNGFTASAYAFNGDLDESSNT